MKILLIYYEPFISGQTTHVLSLANELSARGHNVTVVYPSHLHFTESQIPGAGIKTNSLKIGKFIWNRSTTSTIYRLIKKENFDIIHVHSQEAGITARLWVYLSAGRNIVYTPQTIDIRKPYLKWLYSFFELLLATTSARIISVSKSDRYRLIEWGIPERKIVTIPNGIDFSLPDKWQGEIGNGHLDNFDFHHTPVVKQVSRLSYQKDPLAFVDGAVLILQKNQNVHFELSGDGPLRNAINQKVAALRIKNDLSVLGYQPDAYRHMGNADIVTLTSRWEGLPYTVIEAMAWAKPVVAMAVNGCKDVIVDGETGFLIPPGDVNAWSERILFLLQNPKFAREMGKKGQIRGRELFSIDRMVNQIENLYREVIRH